MLKRLQDFKLSACSCVEASDVGLVHGLIDVMWSSSRQADDGKARFEEFVRTGLYPQLQEALGCLCLELADARVYL